MRLISTFLSLFIVLTVTAPAHADNHMHPRIGDLKISHIWSRATPPNAKTGVAYLHIENTGNSDDTLKAVSSDAAGHTMVHESKMENGVMTMAHVMALKIPAGTTVELKPGSYHVMLTDLNAPLRATSSFKLTLTFERAGEITLDVPVLLPGKTKDHSH